MKFSLLFLLVASTAWAEQSCGTIPSWLDQKQLSFELKSGKRTEVVTAEFPDLKSVGCTVEGDWGPNYHFQLNPEHPLVVKFSSGRSLIVSGELEASSVMRASEREKTPHFFRIPDQKLRRAYDIYLTSSGKVAKVVQSKL